MREGERKNKSYKERGRVRENILGYFSSTQKILTVSIFAQFQVTEYK